MKSHGARVEEIAEQIRRRSASDGFASMQKSAVSHFVPDPRDPRHRDRKIDVSALKSILGINVEAKRCVAEPGVTFSDLVKETLPRGLLPRLVPELKTITLGGAIAGCSVESMSYKYGGFHDSCRSYELITGTGEVRRCSPDQDPLLFHMLHGSYGTLGVVTEIEFDLIPAKPFVRMEYVHFDSFETFHTAMMAKTADETADFIDAIIHSPTHFVLCLGHFADQAPYVSDYTRLEIYYKSTITRREDFFKTYDYLFRYDTECHWLSRSVPGMESKPMRFLFGNTLLGSTNLLQWSKRLGGLGEKISGPQVVVDLFIPNDHFAKFYQWYEQKLNYFPMWVVPYRIPKPYPWISEDHAKKFDGEMFIDCAIYGKRNDEPGVNYYQLLEDKTRELGGIKTLISKNFYDEQTFWTVYNRANYDRVKNETDPKNLFRGLYEKFHFQPGAQKGAVAEKPRKPQPVNSQYPSA